LTNPLGRLVIVQEPRPQSRFLPGSDGAPKPRVGPVRLRESTRRANYGLRFAGNFYRILYIVQDKAVVADDHVDARAVVCTQARGAKNSWSAPIVLVRTG
jgi:hypothetical protein